MCTEHGRALGISVTRECECSLFPSSPSGIPLKALVLPRDQVGFLCSWLGQCQHREVEPIPNQAGSSPTLHWVPWCFTWGRCSVSKKSGETSPCTDSMISLSLPESRGTEKAVSRVMATVTLSCLWGHPHSTKCLPSISLDMPQEEVHGELTPACSQVGPCL